MNKNKTTIDNLKMDRRLHKYIYRTGARTIEDVLNLTPKEIGRIRGVGKVTLKEITDAIDNWINEQDEISQIKNTPYCTKISDKKKPLIHSHPPVKEGQYNETIQKLWLDNNIKELMVSKDINDINTLLSYKEDEIVHKLGFSEKELNKIIKSIKLFQKGIKQPMRLGLMHPFENPSQYNEDISILSLNENTEEHLKNNNIFTLGDLSQHTEQDLLTIEGIGQTKADEIKSHYQNYEYGYTFIRPSDKSLPQTLNDPANRLTFDTRTERGLSRVKGYKSGDMTVEDLLNHNLNQLANIRDFGKASTMRLINTLSEWLEYHEIDPKPFILLKTHIPPKTVEGQLYRLKFTNRVYDALLKWNNDNPLIIDLLNTEVTELINKHNMTIATVRKIVQTIYIWCKDHNINPVGYKLFENDYLHKGVENYIRQHPVLLKNGEERRATVSRIKTPTNKGLFTKISLVVRYNNKDYRISKGNELIKGYPIHFDLIEKL